MGVDIHRRPSLNSIYFIYAKVTNTVTATPALKPDGLVTWTDTNEHVLTVTSPLPLAQQCWSVALLGPVTVAEIPVVVGLLKPQGLVNTVAVTDSVLSLSSLSLMFSIIPVIVAFAGITTALLENWDVDEDVPKPTHPPSLTDWSVPK